MGVAADCQYVSQYGNKDNATKQILNDWNLASSLYKSTFNVSLGIVELQVQDSRQQPFNLIIEHIADMFYLVAHLPPIPACRGM